MENTVQWVLADVGVCTCCFEIDIALQTNGKDLRITVSVLWSFYSMVNVNDAAVHLNEKPKNEHPR